MASKTYGSQTAAIGIVRAFNRTVTQRVGALNEAYLELERPLGASRVLWEIAESGTDARSIRNRLDLDSGYLSRLLRMLEGKGLISVEPDSSDQRVRVIRLTEAGRAERAELDRRSNQLAWSLVEGLDDERRSELLEAMKTVQRLLIAGLIDIRVEDPRSDAARFCIESYFDEINRRFDAGFDREANMPGVFAMAEPQGLFLVARLRGEPIGCGGLRFHADEPPDIKRMWISPDARGLGLGRRLLSELERHAREHGATIIRLETNRVLREAIQLYRSAGYVEVPPFNDELYAHHWFEKQLSD